MKATIKIKIFETEFSICEINPISPIFGFDMISIDPPFFCKDGRDDSVLVMQNSFLEDILFQNKDEEEQFYKLILIQDIIQ